MTVATGYPLTVGRDSEHGVPLSGPLLSEYWRRAVAELIEAAAQHGHMRGVVAVSRTSLISVLSFVESTGGSWNDVGAEPLWRVKRSDSRLAHGVAFDRWREQYATLRLGEDGLTLVPSGALLELDTSAGRFMVAADEHTEFQTTVLIHSGTREQVVALLDAYYRWLDALESVFNVWGGGSALSVPRAVAEDDLILPDDLKRSLVEFVDQFAVLCDGADSIGVPVRRGMLLAGRPGTGKTQFVRHLRSRLPGAQYHMYLPAEDQVPLGKTFASMLQSVRHAAKPAVIILEEVDRMLNSRSITPEFLLNSLDGMLELATPVMWIATTNDPAALEHAFLDRPGRFDRVFIFTEPEPAEREQMLRRFSRGRLDDMPELAAFVAASDGLTGSHIAAACNAAIVAEHTGEAKFTARLEDEIAVMQRHHANRDRYASLVRDGRPVGFAPARG